jgi:hypothetical protein
VELWVYAFLTPELGGGETNFTHQWLYCGVRAPGRVESRVGCQNQSECYGEEKNLRLCRKSKDWGQNLMENINRVILWNNSYDDRGLCNETISQTLGQVLLMDMYVSLYEACSLSFPVILPCIHHDIPMTSCILCIHSACYSAATL